MLKVIGAGFPRTGTSSMKAALERLGFGPCYHMFEILTRPDHVDRWLPAAEGRALDWDHVLEGYRSAMDWPASHFWREQAEAYPEAKVVLTVRDPARWRTSMQALISNGPRMLATTGLPPAAEEVLGSMRRLSPLLDMIGREAFGPEFAMARDLPPVEVATEFFELHTETVRRTIAPERLLVFDVREGWEPLCAFLGAEVPEEPFPHLNDADAMKSMLTRLTTEGVVNSPFTGG
ncbi:sulfotransferase family protein [Nonomuraea sp. NPDC050394]|uniref:sulfotransferase family protein n=1 Tax=Nonomuraea sp. NPDC050394 TaxID=3364363 RepID=UPI0037AC0A66